MASYKNKGKNVAEEEDWAFVDIHGVVLAKEKTNSRRKKNEKQKKKVRSQKQDDPDFEVIRESSLTMSTIIATTEVAPFQKEMSEAEDDWGIVRASDPGPDLAVAPTQNVDTRVEGKPESSIEDDVEFIQIPERPSHSDTMSTCSFDVIDENKRNVLLENDPIDKADDVDSDDEDNGSIDVSDAEFHFDFPTMVALFCLTTVLGFVIGHGVGIATSLLVVKTPNLKPPPDITQNLPSTSSSDGTTQKNEDSQLERKIQKWKSLYRKERQEEIDGAKNSKFENPPNMPGLKEAHKQLSLENYKLKKAYSDIQKQLDLMKVMSWYRRAQVDKLQQNDPFNMSNVVGILKKELQYLEAVYFREKRLADMWRNEEKEKTENPSNTWKYFKDRWSKKYHGDEGSREPVCMDKRECGGETSTDEDRSGSNSEISVDHIGTLGITITVIDEEPEVTQTQSKNAVPQEEGRGNVKTDAMFSPKDGMQRPPELRNLMDYKDIPDERESLFWRHLRLAKSVEEEDLKDHSKNEDQIKLSSQEIKNDDEAQTSDANDKTLNDEGPSDVNNEVTDTTERNSGGLLAPVEPEWFSYELLEEDDDTIIAHENKDSVPHVVYGFLLTEFREIVSGPGDIFVMSIKTECFDLNSSFVVSLLNNSPKPIQFFALLPNGKIKHQKVAGQVKVTIVEVGSNDGDQGDAQPLIFEATVMENGKLKVIEQKNAVESGEQNDKNQNEGSKTDVETGDGQVEKDEQNEDGAENDEEYDDEHRNGENDVNQEALKRDDQTGENKVEANKDQNSEVRQGDPEETSHANQEVSLSDLKPGESYMFDQYTARMYRHTVSVHQYPISEYENLLSETHKKIEQVYYRFPGSFIIEKFIVKDEIVKTNDDGTVSVGEDNKGSTGNTVGEMEPLEYEEEVLNTIRDLLKNPWKEGYRNLVLMSYDSTTGAVTLIYAKLFKVHLDDVISHDELKNCKIETLGDYSKITSYLLHGNELLRIEREDEIITTGEELMTTGEVDDGSMKTTGEVDDGNIEKENSSDSENEEKSGNFENTAETNSDDLPNGNSSQTTTLENSEETLEESHQEQCTLGLGDSDTTEYWAYDIQGRASFIRDTVERVMPTPNFKEEDMRKLSISTMDSEESVSYIYCDDGSVQKSWRQIEKAPRNKAPEKSNRDTESDDSEGLREKWTDDSGVDGDEEKYDDNDDHDYDYEHDMEEDIDDDIDDEIDDERVKNYEDQDEFDDLEYNDEDDLDDGVDHDNIADDNSDATDDESDDESAVKEESKNSDVHENSNEPASIHDNDEKDLEKEKYEMFISREWQNLKLRQQQLDHSKEQNMRLQQQMLEEWNEMKQQYRQFHEKIQTNQKPGRDVEIEGIWTDQKHQQTQFESMKKQIEEELRKSLQEEWEKLKKKQTEIENRERLLYVDEETVVRYHFPGHQTITADTEGDSDEQQETKWEPDNDDTLVPKLQQDSEVPNKHHFETEQKTEAEMKTSYEDYNPETQWSGNMVEEDSDIDKAQSDAWEMHEEENLPHELPYISESNEKDDLHIDKMLSEVWELNQEPSNTNEEQYMNDENIPHEIAYIPSTGSNKVTRVSENIFNIVARQKEEGVEVMSYTTTEITSQDDNVMTKQSKEHSKDTSDTQSSSQWELQIKKLREELDRLYEAKKNERNGLQVVTYDTKVPKKLTEDLKTESQTMFQTRCPAKCPPGNSECSPKCPKDDATDDVSPINYGPLAPNQKKSKQESFRKRLVEKEQPSKLEKDEKKLESSAFMNYIEGHSFLRQLEPEEYDHKMPALRKSALAPKKKTKKSKKKAKPTNETDHSSKSNQNNRKERRPLKRWEKYEQEAGLDKPLKNEKKQNQEFQNDYPLRPLRGKKNARKGKRIN